VPDEPLRGWRFRASVVEHFGRWLLPILVFYVALNLVLPARAKELLVETFASSCEVPGGLCSVQLMGKVDCGSEVVFGIGIFTVYWRMCGGTFYGEVPLLLPFILVSPAIVLAYRRPWLFDRSRRCFATPTRTA